MSKDEFLSEIEKEAGFMLPDKKREVMTHFRSLFPCNASEDAVIEGLGTPAKALRSYLSDNKRTCGKCLPDWAMATMALLASPIAVFGGGAAIMIISIAMIALIALLTAMPLAGAAMWIGGIKTVLESVSQHIIFADKLMQIGMGFLSGGIGIFLIFLTYKVYKKVVPRILKGTARMYKRIGEFIKNETV